MSVASRPVSTGKTRTCPHCKATILESLSICPGCMHHLRFDSEAAKRQVAAAPALRVEGIIRHPPLEQPLEYFVIIAIRNDRGEEVTRQVVNVGALQAAEKRTFSLSVEVLPPAAPVPTKSNAATGTFKAPVQQPAATVRPQDPASSGATASGGSAAQQGSAAAQSTAQSSSGGGRPSVQSPTARPGTPAPASSGAKPGGQPPASSAPKPGVGSAPTGGSGTPASGASPAGANKPATSASGTPALGASTPGASSQGASSQGTPTSGQPGLQPGSTTSTNKPESGYVLKPPSPGGPKRH